MSVILVDKDIIATVLQAMGLSDTVDAATFFEALDQEAQRNPRLLAAIRSVQPGDPVPGVMSKPIIGPANLTPEERARKQKLIQLAEAEFKEEPPTIY